MRTAIDFVGSAYKDNSLPVSAQECINWIPEAVETSSGRSATVYRDAPGHTVVFTLDGSGQPVGVRGWLPTQVQPGTSVGTTYVDRLFAVVGNNFLVIDPVAGTVLSTISNVISGTGQVQMAYNGTSVLIVTGANIPKCYAYNIVPVTAVQASAVIQDITYTATAPGVAGNKISIQYVCPSVVQLNMTVVTTTTIDGTLIVVTLANTGSPRGSTPASSGLFPTTGGSGPGGAVGQWDVFTVAGVGTLSGVTVNNGDRIRAKVATPGQASTNWDINSYTPINTANDVSMTVAALAPIVTPAVFAGTGGNLEVVNPAVTLSGGVDAVVVGILDITTNCPFTPGGVTYVGGYYVIPEFGGRRWFISGLNAFTFDGLAFATAESATDSIIAVAQSHGQLWIYCGNSIEIWDITGGDFPFSRSVGASIEKGAGSRFGVVEFDNSMAWISNKGVVYHANGYSPKRISTYAIEQDILTAGITNAIVETYRDGGHNYLVLHMDGAQGPQTLKTWCYDAATGEWHRRKSYRRPNWLATNIAAFSTYTLIADNLQANTINVYSLSTLVSDEAGQPLIRERITGYLSADQTPLNLHSLELVMRTGFAQAAGTVMQTLPVVELRYSDDWAGNWSSWKARALGPVGHLIQRVRFTQLGRFRNRTFHIRVSDPIRAEFIAATVNGEQDSQQ